MSVIYPSSMPYDAVNIVDESSYVEEVAVEAPYIPTGPVAFIPFISPRGYGEDNKLEYMTAAKLAKYGNPNLKKYGLSLYLANRVIAGGGSVLGMRVTTGDSWGYAYNIFTANVKQDTSAPYKYIDCHEDGGRLYPIITFTFNNGTTDSTSDDVVTKTYLTSIVATNRYYYCKD